MSEQPITNEQLIRYATGDLEPAEAAAAKAHLSNSPLATKYMEKVRSVLSTMQADDTQAPSLALIKRTIATFSAGVETGEGRSPLAWLEPLRQVVAQLIFDSRAQPALAGFRGSSDSYQLTYKNELACVELGVSQQQTQRDIFRLRGQTTTEQKREYGSVALLSTGSNDPQAVSEMDKHGRFKFDAKPGKYDLAVQIGDEALIVQEISIG